MITRLQFRFDRSFLIDRFPFLIFRLFETLCIVEPFIQNLNFYWQVFLRFQELINCFVLHSQPLLAKFLCLLNCFFQLFIFGCQILIRLFIVFHFVSQCLHLLQTLQCFFIAFLVHIIRIWFLGFELLFPLSTFLLKVLLFFFKCFLFLKQILILFLFHFQIIGQIGHLLRKSMSVLAVFVIQLLIFCLQIVDLVVLEG